MCDTGPNEGNGDGPGGAVTPEEAAAMLRTVLRLFDRWGLDNGQKAVLLGGVSARSMQRWRRQGAGRIPPDTIHRMGDLLGIHKALRHVFTDLQHGYAWIGRPNRVFAGMTPLDVMLQGRPGDISRVRAYLDAEREGW
jgi:uncharacterized protein (DUF2384 family)